MKLDDAELEQSYYQPIGTGIDKSLGYVLMVFVVVVFFSLFLFGIQHTQAVSNQIVEGHAKPANAPSVSEIGDSGNQ